MSTIPPPGVGPAKGPESSEVKKKEENPVSAASNKMMWKGEEAPKGVLESKNFRHLAEEGVNYSVGDIFSKIWAKVSSLWNKDTSNKEPEEDLSYQIEVSQEELRSLANNTDSLIDEVAANQRDSEGVIVDTFIRNQLDVQNPAQTEEERGIDAAKNLNEQIRVYGKPVLDKARASANPQEMELLNKAAAEETEALENLKNTPNDENTTKLTNAMSALNKVTDTILARVANEKNQVVGRFKTQLDQVKKQIPTEEVKYTNQKESSGQWRVYIDARNQLNNALREAENDVLYYENGQRPTFDGAKHLDDIRAITEKLRDAIANYDK